jgi:hypothetical protein
MGARFPSQAAVALAVSYGGGAFNQFCVATAPVTPTYDGQPILIFWSLRYPAGATAPIGSYDIRRGNTSGAPLISTAQSITEAASSAVYRSGVVLDTALGLAQATYGLFHNISNAATGYAYTECVIAAIAL